jgi:hypothetical protein
MMVFDEENIVAVFLFCDMVGQSADGKDVITFKKRNPVFRGKALVG